MTALRNRRLAGVVIPLVLAAGRPAHGQDVESGADARREFEAIADGLESGDNRYHGRAPLLEMRARLELPPESMPPMTRAQTSVRLVIRLLELGEVAEARTRMETMMASLRDEPGLAQNPILKRVVGLVYLRQAEVQNCVVRHNADCCIFPLAGGALHVDTEPAEAAQRAFSEFLDQAFDGKIQWLLNITAMALGTWPDGVDERWRLPESGFASEYDAGRFPDIAPQLGLDTVDLCGGVVIEDFDGDERLDIITSTSDPRGPLTFHRNAGDGTFEDWSERSGLTNQLGGLNLVAADYDNDGDPDLLVLRGAWLFDDGQIRNSLLRNEGGGHFVDVTRGAGLADPAQPSQVATWADFDNDGWLDVYIGAESRPNQHPQGNYPSQLFHNNGDGTFTDIAATAGVTNDGYCKGVAAGDYDDDGDMDLYVSNVGPNHLYRNEGDGTFAEVTSQSGTIGPERRSFATWFFDYDNDGDLDLFVAPYDATTADLCLEAQHAPHHAGYPCLYRNDGGGAFTDITAQAGLERVMLPMGANFGDIDNDGWLDLYLATGDPDFQSLMPNIMLRHDGTGWYQDVTTAGGFGHLQKGHGVAFADLDEDGDQDVYNQLGGFYPGDRFHNALFLNPGHGHRFVVMRLIGTTGNRSAVGARVAVTVDTPNGRRTIHRAVGSVSSFGGSPLRQEIGLGDATGIVDVSVRWPGETEAQPVRGIELDGAWRVTQGQAQAERRSYTALPMAR